MIHAIEHIAIFSADSKALAQWYCDTLGFEMALASEENRTYFVKLPGGGMFEILPANAKPRPDNVMDDAGLRHIALAVDDFEATYQALKARGITYAGPVRESFGGSKLVFFTDPDGNLLHLVWRAKPL